MVRFELRRGCASRHRAGGVNRSVIYRPLDRLDQCTEFLEGGIDVDAITRSSGHSFGAIDNANGIGTVAGERPVSR